MDSNPVSTMSRKHAKDWVSLFARGVSALALLICLHIPADICVAAQTTQSAVRPGPPSLLSPSIQPPRHRLLQLSSAPATPVVRPAPAALGPPAIGPEELRKQLDTVREQLAESREILRQAAQAQHRTRLASLLFLAVFALIAGLIVLQVYVQARGWHNKAARAGAELEAVHAQLEALRSAPAESRGALPRLLQDVGEHPLSYQEEGTSFAPGAFAIIDDIDHLAYVGQGRLAFRELPSEPEAAVFLNGLLLSAVAHLGQSNPWTAFSRLDQFFSRLARFPDAVERLRIAQGYSYRALAAYQVLEAQDREPSWLRKAERAQIDTLSKQAFADVAHALSVDPDWKHAAFVEALLCGRFYLAEEAADTRSRGELLVRGLRRAVSLYKGLIDERCYRGPSRRNLVRALKQIAEHTGDKGDFSDFGYALNSFPSDEELADEVLAARQPNSQDRFLWQWLLGDEELFARVERLNLSEYRAFWIRMLDSKVRLRNWRSDLAELRQAKPAMKDWAIQLLQPEQPISLSSAISRRQERYDSSASGA